MPYCCVPGYKVHRISGSQPVYMARFPSSVKHAPLREQWIKNISKYSFHNKPWQPSACAVVCEKHFSRQMWESIRVDGTRKLKRNVAVPTLFDKHEENNIGGDNENASSEVEQCDEDPETDIREEDVFIK